MAETNDILEVAKMTISTSIKCNTVRGFIGWHSCDNICMDMHDVLDMCEDAFKRERYQESLEADTYVLVSGVKLASCADSSSGMLTDVIMRAFELIDLSTQTIAKLDAAMRKHALSLIIKEAKKKAFDGWDSWRYELLEKAVCLCDEKLAAKLEKLLDIFLEDIENDYMPEYKRQEDTILRYKLHRHLKGADAVKDELYANLYIREMCIIAVKDATDARNYNEAEKLCLEQIKKEDGRFYRNTPEDWNNILFDVYMQSGITDKQIEQAKKSEHNMSILRHDMRHQLNQISALAETGDLEGLKSYLEKNISRIPNLGIHFCENRAADSVIGYYCALAKREDIPFCAKLDLPQTLPIDEINMCLVLSNLLENALEASIRTAPDRRQIKITAYLHAGRLLLIEVENAYDGEIREKDGVFQSSKRKGNGVGIQSIQHIAEKSGGASTFACQNGVFSAKVMLCG